jgi:hypothetical protein
VSNQVKHTAEPWKVQKPHAGNRGFEIADSSGLNQVCQDVNEANARRIVACVNACRGLPTDELEQRGLVQAVGAELIELTNQRDQLLAALKNLDEAYCSFSFDMDREQRLAGRNALINARQTIAAIKGGAA